MRGGGSVDIVRPLKRSLMKLSAGIPGKKRDVLMRHSQGQPLTDADIDLVL